MCVSGSTDGNTVQLHPMSNESMYVYTVSDNTFMVAHHGSKYSTGNEFLEAAAPALAIISCGVDNSYGHPHKETIDRLTNSKSVILQTKESGAVTVITDGRLIKIVEYSR